MRSVVTVVLVTSSLLGLTARAASIPPALVDERLLAASLVPEGPFPKVMLDPLGNAVTLRDAPRRVVSRALVADELLLEVARPEQLVGLTYLIDDPSVSPLAEHVPDRIRRTRGGIEEVLALEPDLVVVADYSEGAVTAQLLTTNAHVLRLGSYASFADVVADFRRLGAALGEEDRARAATNRLEGRIRAVEQRAGRGAQRRVLYLSSGSYTAGKGTLTDECIRRAGASNVARELGIEGTSPVSVERIVALAPEIVLIGSRGTAMRRAAPPERPDGIPWEVLPATQSDNVYLVPAAWFGTVSHHAVLALEAIATIVDGAPGGARR